jgi:hypothetical protein
MSPWWQNHRSERNQTLAAELGIVFPLGRNHQRSLKEDVVAIDDQRDCHELRAAVSQIVVKPIMPF